VTFNPTAPGTPALAKVSSSSPLGLSQAACPSVSQCTALDPYANSGVTFNPNSPGAPIRIALAVVEPTSLVCPSVERCTALAEKQEVTFNPNSPGASTPVTFDGGAEGGVVACSSVSQCTVFYRYHRTKIVRERTFDPASHNLAAAVTLGVTDAARSLACPSVTQCTTAGGAEEMTFNPQSPGAAIARCAVPKLNGKTLAQAKKLLGRSHCKLGKVTRPAAHKHALVVLSQSPAAKKSVPAGTKVSLRLG
jgi:hypothetical protein